MTVTNSNPVPSLPSLDWLTHGRPTERRDAAAHREKILTTARELFDQQGIEVVSMHQIAQAAGVGQGTLYRRYCSKGELCLDLLGESVQRWCADLLAYLEGAASTEPALARLDAVVVSMVQFSEQNTELLGALDEGNKGAHHGIYYRNPVYRWLHAVVAALLSEARAAGDIRPVDPVFTADVLLAALHIDFLFFQQQERSLTSEQIMDGIRRVYLDGLRCEQ